LAYPQKFPHPAIQVHYARGCTLAESYYQSVRGPFQLLIVGDPLCRPWANIPEVEVTGVRSEQSVSGTLTLSAQGTSSGSEPVDRFEWYVNGVRFGGSAPGEVISIDTSQVADGWAEISVAGIEATSVATQGRVVIPIRINNHGHSVRFVGQTDEVKRARWGSPLKVSVEAAGAKSIAIYNFTRPLGEIEGAAGELTIRPVQLGFGRVLLSAVAMFDDDKFAISDPLEMQIESFPPLPAVAKPVTALRPGLKLEAEGARPVTIVKTSQYNWLEQAGVRAAQSYTLSGYFEVRLDDIYQFQTRHTGDLMITVDGQGLHQVTGGKMDTMHYVPVPLRKGWHKLVVTGKSDTAPRLDMRFGGPGAFRLSRVKFSHD
jgi:hypothetical protein